MFIQTIPWHFAGFGRLVDYVQKEKQEEGELSLEVYHNIQEVGGREELIEQLLANDEFRVERKNGVALYHEIMSFSGEDREHLTLEIIEDLTRTYLEKRAPNALAYAGIHEEMHHLHIHIIISGNSYHSKETTRLDKADFIALRQEIEAYQQEQYPELRHSIAYKERERSTPRLDLVSTLNSQVLDAFESSSTLTDVASKLDEYELTLYTYRGKLTGVIMGGQKFRFRRLGIDPTPVLLGVHERSQEMTSSREAPDDDISSVTFTDTDLALSKALYTETHDHSLRESEFESDRHFQELLEIRAREKLAAQYARHEKGPSEVNKRLWRAGQERKLIDEERTIWRESQEQGISPDEYIKQQEIEQRQAEAEAAEQARHQEAQVAAQREAEEAMKVRAEAERAAEEARIVEAQRAADEIRSQQEEEQRRQMEQGRGE